MVSLPPVAGQVETNPACRQAGISPERGKSTTVDMNKKKTSFACLGRYKKEAIFQASLK